MGSRREPESIRNAPVRRVGMSPGRCRDGLRPWMIGSWVCLAACSGTTADGKGAENASGRVRRDTTMQHEACDTAASGTERVDLNRDGRPDVSVVRSGSTERCRSVDLNFDGHIDVWIYRESNGQVRRRETDFDKDGRIDEVAHFEHGLVTSKERASTLVGRVDTWQVYKGGKLSSGERDADGDGFVDQWWEFPKPDQIECPVVHLDTDGDGKPDPVATVDLCPPAPDASGDRVGADGNKPASPETAPGAADTPASTAAPSVASAPAASAPPAASPPKPESASGGKQTP
jgi:hypothetical protein